MTHWLLVMPVFIPLLTATVCAFSFHARSWSSVISWCGAIATLCIAMLLMQQVISKGLLVTAFGNWPPPFGIVFVADLLSASMVLITAIIGIAIVLYSTTDLRSKPSYAIYHSLIHALLGGVTGSFLTGDIFNLYVFFEVILITSFGLMVLDANKQQVDAAVKYVVLNLISTMVFLLAIGLLYGAVGTLNMASLHAKVAELPDTIMRLISGLFLFGFAIKAAAFPVFSWLPASYHHLPNAIVALYAALLTKVGVYALMRIFTIVFDLVDTGFQPLLIIISGLTMLTGVLGATSQFNIKRILSFHIISQIGYMLMGLAIYTPLAITGAIFYIIHHIIVKANLFLIGGFLKRKQGSDNLRELGDAYNTMPWLALLFLIPAFSLAGFPPLSGFWGKFLVIKASLQTENYLLAATALFVSLLTIYSMTKIWAEAFWKPLPENATAPIPIPRKETCLYIIPIAALAVITILVGLMVEPIYQLAETSATNLLNPQPYIDAVLGNDSTPHSAHISAPSVVAGGLQ